jgi:hypothetical protein
MDLVSIALVVVALWIGVIVFVVAISKASGNADAEAERYFAETRDDVPEQSRAPHYDLAPGDDRTSIDAAVFARENKRLRIETPERRRLHLPHLVGTHRHRS